MQWNLVIGSFRRFGNSRNVEVSAGGVEWRSRITITTHDSETLCLYPLNFVNVLLMRSTRAADTNVFGIQRLERLERMEQLERTSVSDRLNGLNEFQYLLNDWKIGTAGTFGTAPSKPFVASRKRDREITHDGFKVRLATGEWWEKLECPLFLP